MQNLDRLKAATTLVDLAGLLRVRPSSLAYVLYKIPDEAKYAKFTINKKNGGSRLISAPDPRLKLIQRRLAKLLSQCELEIEAKLKIKPQCTLAHGFKSGFSIQTNAVNHRGQRWVLNVDLKDFFPSINFGRVYGFFIRNQNYGLNKKIATLIAQIACHENALPQGSPSSPVISNIVAHLMDIRLNELATMRGCTYTRYADDLTFSTGERLFPASIAERSTANLSEWVAGRGLEKRIAKAGFTINGNKTRMQFRDSRQEATGLVVNKRVNVKSRYYKLARSMCRQMITTGGAYRTVGGAKSPISVGALKSVIAFIYQVKRWDDERRKTELIQIETSAYFRLYAEFLNYASFFGQSCPTIVCEGKTDNVYLRCAMRSLSAAYPTLVSGAGKQRRLDVHLFKFTKTADQVQKLSGGATQLSNLLSDYRKRIGNCKGMALHPTIILVDNDSGPEKLFLHLSNVIGRKVDGSEPFYFAYENLYVVPVPKVGGKFTAMEDLFEKKLLDTKLNGRILDLSNKEVDGKKYYSKNEFSVQVVQKKQSRIDFSGFKPLLDNIVAVQKDYATKVAAQKAASP